MGNDIRSWRDIMRANDESAARADIDVIRGVDPEFDHYRAVDYNGDN